MRSFSTTRKAKEYLIGAIADEAGREGVELSEIERKMLYFSESGWTLPNMLKVNEEFESKCDSDQYERKIASLIRGIVRRADRAQGEIEDWDNAVSRLSDEDHYLLVLIDLAVRKRGNSGSWSRWLPSLNTRGSKRPEGDVFRLIAAAVVLCTILLVVVLLRAALFR